MSTGEDSDIREGEIAVALPDKFDAGLYFMHQARRDLVMQAARHHTQPRSTFSLRSPVRPNPIALSVTRLVRVEGTRLTVVGLDCLDGTPLIDIKPYFASVDSVPEAVVDRGQNE